MNRLADEASPYLRQHRDNPVDWYPWSDEAFARAEAEQRPVLLSVGYASCHWCHVMAAESFQDPETAATMNERFVNVKVDREERPDIDAIYLDALTAMAGRGGWPMTVFLTPRGEPFFGGTYFPKTRRGDMPAFTDVLEQVSWAWRFQRGQVLARAASVAARLGRDEPRPRAAADDGVFAAAVDKLASLVDPVAGGFGDAPKFPHAPALDAMLRSGDTEAIAAASASLDAMAAGGLYDHLGGGFARYAVDREWRVPHFEKMLYDNALLARTYLHGWQATGSEQFRQVLDETVDYVLRELGASEGGIHSAEDADSAGTEGAFYTWTAGEFRAVLGQSASDAIAWYGVTEAGNFEGRSVLYRPDRSELRRPAEIGAARRLLLEARNERPRPGVDDKVLTEWNALMVATLAEAGAATANTAWLEAGAATARFLVDNLRREDGRWLRSWRRGVAQHLAYAADYAALVDAFVRLAEATGEARWISEAGDTADALLDLFWDERRGGVYTTGHDAEMLVARPKDLVDRSTPAANSVAAVALARLATLTGEDRYAAASTEIITLVGATAADQPLAYGQLLAAIDLAESGTTEIVVVGDRPDLVQAVHTRYLPRAVVAWGQPYDSPLWAHREEGHAYVCRNYACQLPATDVDGLLAQLARG